MSVTGMTRWQICQKCGRKFVAAVRNPDADNWPAECPTCRTGAMRKLLKDMTAKWLKNNKVK